LTLTDASRARSNRGAALRLRILLAGYLMVVAAFFVLDARAHRLLYHAALTAPLLLLLIRDLPARPLLARPAMGLSLLFLGYLALSALWSVAAGPPQMLEQMAKGLSVGTFLLATLVLAERVPDFEEKLAAAVALAGLALGAASIAVHIAGTPAADLATARLSGIGRGANANFAAVLFAAAALCAETCRRRWRGRPGLRILASLALGVCVLALCMTQSRGPVLAFAAACALMLAAQRRWRALAALALAAAAASWAAYSHLRSMPVVARADSYRLEIWQRTWDHIVVHPWFGVGVATERPLPMADGVLIPFPHSILISNQYYGGVVASLLLGLLLLAVAAGLLRRHRAGGDPLPAALLCLGMVAGLFDFRLVPRGINPEYLYFWLPVALAAAASPRQSSVGQPYASDSGAPAILSSR